MSGICGLISWSNDPAKLSSFAEMLNALSHLGLDGASKWQQTLATLGHQARHVTHESRLDQQPLHDINTGLTITADVRLDNRDVLFRQLSVPVAYRNNWSDSRIILAAYLKWGEDFPHYLLGDFALAIWDAKQRRLICCRDHLGIRPLFYQYTQHHLAFASEAKAIVATFPEAQPNKRKIALLAYPAVMKTELEDTFFKGVSSLPAATILIVSERSIHQRVYWEPDRNERLPYKNDGECLEALRSLLTEAVNARLRSCYPVTSLLSGGLDSSAIVSVAAHSLAQQGKSLTTLSSVLPDDLDQSGMSDEREYIDEFKSWSNIDLKYITATRSGPFDDLKRLVWGYEGPGMTHAHYLYTAFANEACKQNSRVILDGAGGEQGLTCHGQGFYTDLLLRARWPQLWSELKSRGQLNNVSPWTLFRAHVLRPLLPNGVANTLRSIASPQHEQREHLHVLQPSFLAQQLGNQHTELRKTHDRTYRENLFLRNHQHASLCRARKPSRVAGFVGYEQVEMRYPLLDKRLLEFCLAAPATLKVHNGYNRYLVRSSLEGLMPTKIQWRTTKKPFSPNFHTHYNSQRLGIVNFFAAIKPNDPVREVVDVEKLKRWVACDMSGARGTIFEDYAAMHGVTSGVYLITFLRQFDEFST